MARFSSILIVYFVIGAVMWGGGAIVWEDSGVGQFIIDDPNYIDADDDGVNEEATGILNRLSQPIQNVVGTVGGGIIAIWNLLAQFIGYLFWPITVLQSANAPPRVVVLGGGSLVMAFFGSFIRTIRTSA